MGRTEPRLEAMGFEENQALSPLKGNPGKWHCIPCWSRVAAITSPEDLQALNYMARTRLEADPLYQRVALEDAQCDIRWPGCDSEPDPPDGPRRFDRWGYLVRYSPVR